MQNHELPSQQPEYEPSSGLTLEDDREAARILKKWNGGRLSTPLFTEIARIVPQPIVEVVVFRMNQGELETLIIPRPDDDIVWPGMYHTPGSAYRAADFLRADNNPLNGPLDRIQNGELGNKFIGLPMYVGAPIPRPTARGPEIVNAYIAELPENAVLKPGHLWYPVDRLADNPLFIEHQLGHVQMAAQAYRILKNQ